MRRFRKPGAVRGAPEDTLASRIRDAALRDLFSLVGAPPAQDADLQVTAARLLREHLEHVAAGEVEPTAGVAGASSNVSCLGSLDDLHSDLARHGRLHAWGHFIARPRAHAEALAACTAADGVPRVYMATAWRA